MKIVRLIAILLLLASLLVLVPSGAYVGEAENVKIALNAATGKEPQESGYKSLPRRRRAWRSLPSTI